MYSKQSCGSTHLQSIHGRKKKIQMKEQMKVKGACLYGQSWPWYLAFSSHGHDGHS